MKSKMISRYCSTIMLVCASLIIASEVDALSIKSRTSYPSGGEIFLTSQKYTIRWQPQRNAMIDPVDIWLWDGRKSNWRCLARDFVSSLPEFEWLIPSDLRGDRFRIRVTHTNDQSIELTRTYFSIGGENLTIRPESGGTSGKRVSSHSLAVFPNPSSGRITVSWKGAANRLVLRSILGEQVLTQVLHGESSGITLNVSELSKGSYYAAISYEDGTEEQINVLLTK